MGFGGVAIAAMLGLASASADEEPICADRPGLATPTCTVPAGMVQVETTLVDWTRDRYGGFRAEQVTIGETAFKLGLTDRLHVEVGVAPYTRISVSDGALSERVSGFGDLGVAAKYRLTSEAAPVQIAVRPFVKIPTAKRSLGNGEVEGGVVVPIAFAIPGSQLSVTLGPELGVNSDGDGSGHHLATAQVISLGVPLSDRLSASAELWGYWDFDPAGTVRQRAVAASAGYLLSSNLQLDAGVNLGLNRDTPDIQAYSGIAFRF
jgi:hypothetical protein